VKYAACTFASTAPSWRDEHVWTIDITAANPMSWDELHDTIHRAGNTVLSSGDPCIQEGRAIPMGVGPTNSGNDDCISTSNVRKRQEYHCPAYLSGNTPWIQWFKKLTHPSGGATNGSHGRFPTTRTKKVIRNMKDTKGTIQESEEYDDSDLEPEEYDEYVLH
jgi:hypothetical protein